MVQAANLRLPLLSPEAWDDSRDDSRELRQIIRSSGELALADDEIKLGVDRQFPGGWDELPLRVLELVSPPC